MIHPANFPSSPPQVSRSDCTRFVLPVKQRKNEGNGNTYCLTNAEQTPASTKVATIVVQLAVFGRCSRSHAQKILEMTPRAQLPPSCCLEQDLVCTDQRTFLGSKLISVGAKHNQYRTQFSPISDSAACNMLWISVLCRFRLLFGISFLHAWLWMRSGLVLPWVWYNLREFGPFISFKILCYTLPYVTRTLVMLTPGGSLIGCVEEEHKKLNRELVLSWWSGFDTPLEGTDPENQCPQESKRTSSVMHFNGRIIGLIGWATVPSSWNSVLIFRFCVLIQTVNKPRQNAILYRAIRTNRGYVLVLGVQSGMPLAKCEVRSIRLALQSLFWSAWHCRMPSRYKLLFYASFACIPCISFTRIKFRDWILVNSPWRDQMIADFQFLFLFTLAIFGMVLQRKGDDFI